MYIPFYAHISHYLKYVRSKFRGSSYPGRKATVISHFGVRPLQVVLNPNET